MTKTLYDSIGSRYDKSGATGVFRFLQPASHPLRVTWLLLALHIPTLLSTYNLMSIGTNHLSVAEICMHV